MKIRKTTDIHDDGLLGELEALLRSGAIRKTDELDRFAMLINQRFPFVLNRIDWTKVPAHLLLPAKARIGDEARDPDRYFARRASEFRGVIEDAAKQYKIGMETEVLFMGDSISFVLRMKLTTLAEQSPKVFSYPQHVYVMPESGDWCINYTFEDDLFFGIAP
jgi:hypothetical protein